MSRSNTTDPPGKQVTTDCFQAAHKISMKHPHNQKQKSGNDSSQRLSPLEPGKEDGTQHLSHITPSGHDSGTPLRGWTTQHSLALIHLISSLSASSPARLYSSPQNPPTRLIPFDPCCLPYSFCCCRFLHLLHSHHPVLILCPALPLTRGSVPSSVPGGVGCFPASEGSG